MRRCNQRELLQGSVRGLVYILAFGMLMWGVTACSSQNSQSQRRFLFLFDERPFQMNCADWPSPLPPGTHSFVTFSPRAPYARTRLETLDLPLREIPALTIAAEPTNWLQIVGANQDHWTMQFCATGEGNTVDEATNYLQKVSMQRTGSLLTLNDSGAHGLTGGQGRLLLTAPVEAPVTVHSEAAVEVHDMAGPVRISAPRGRAKILNSSGLVDASANVVDFAGSQGPVSLNASWDINIKLTAQQFHGRLNANAQRQVLVFFPPDFQTPVDVYVNRPKDFVCRVDFCSKIKKGRENSLYRFTYGGVTNASEHITLRSENAQVTFEMAQ